MSKATGFPRPELFWPDDDAPEPMAAQLATIAVFKLGTNGEKDQIDYTTAEALPNVNAVRDAYGPGMFELVGRSEHGSIVAKRTLRIALKPGQHWVAPSVASQTSSSSPATSPATPGEQMQGDPMERFLRIALERSNGDPMQIALFQHVLTLSKELAAQSQQSAANMVSAITSLAGARLQDQQGLFETLLRSKPAAGGGATPQEMLRMYEAGMKKTQELIEMGEKLEAEHGGGGDTDITELAKAFVAGMRELREMKEQENVVPMRRSGGNGSNG
jgi:hypothetical protein